MRRQHWRILCGSALGLGSVVLLAALGRAAADPTPIPGDSARSPSDVALPRPAALPEKARAAEPREDWGEPVGGLQVCIAPAEPGPARDAGAPEFLVSLRNAGTKDLTLNLGVMLANGKVQYPNAIRLYVTDGAGKESELKYRMLGVGGRMDDFVVPLPAGAVYSVRINLRGFSSAAAEEQAVHLGKGPFTIAAGYTGRGATCVNSDMEGIALLTFWTGSIRSKPYTVLGG